MDLHSGLPYWIAKNALWNYYQPLTGQQRFRVAVIGSGITGALTAHALCRAGIDCCVIDKRSPGTGSSCASTALLQYEIDIPLCQMVEMMAEEDAVTAYRSCLESIDELENWLRETDTEAGFRHVPSVFYASNRKGLSLIREEYRIRIKHGLPVEMLDKKELYRKMRIKAPGALRNQVSAQTDPYRASLGFLSYNQQKHGLTVYTHTEITSWNKTKQGYRLTAANGGKIECDYVVVAAGFEATPFLPKKLMQLTSTFALISQPVEEKYLWPERSLIWETREPYLYIRTDDSNRIIVGGEDIPFNSAAARKFMLDKKTAILEKKFHKLYPDIPLKTEMAWAGTFSSTKDGLPLIGAAKNDPRMLFALGYGGNGITFSVIAAQLITAAVLGIPDPRTRIFSLDRKSIQ